MSVLMNYALATPLNKTESASSVSLNTTLLPALKSSATIPLHNSTWYATSTTPYSPSYAPFGPPMITYSFTYSYAYCTFLLILLIAAIICIKMVISRRKELKQRAAAQRRRALQQVESVHFPAASDNNHSNSASPGAKDLDLPPTYEDVVKSFMLTRQQDPSTDSTPVENSTGTTHPSSNSLSTAVSTLTIETEISNSNNAVAVHLNNPSNS